MKKIQKQKLKDIHLILQWKEKKTTDWNKVYVT